MFFMVIKGNYSVKKRLKWSQCQYNYPLRQFKGNEKSLFQRLWKYSKNIIFFLRCSDIILKYLFDKLNLGKFLLNIHTSIPSE